MLVALMHQFCDTIEMNILFLNICLLAVTAMAFSYRPSDDSDIANVAAYHGGRASFSERGLNSWSRTLTRHRRDVPKNFDPLYVFF